VGQRYRRDQHRGTHALLYLAALNSALWRRRRRAIKSIPQVFICPPIRADMSGSKNSVGSVKYGSAIHVQSIGELARSISVYMSQQNAMKILRSELYDLVWSQPRTALAKRFAISDVALAKRCVKADIPMPPRGYWAKLESKKFVAQAALPLRLPGASDVISFDRDPYYRSHAVSPEEELRAPIFPEPVETFVAAALARLGRVRATSDLGEPHAGLRRLLATEASRRERFQADPSWSFYKPHFDSPEHQRQLRLINSLLGAFDRLGCKGSAYEKDEWIQGVGTIYHLVASVEVGDTQVSFRIEEPGKPGAGRKPVRN
jgi:hypothetical protein